MLKKVVKQLIVIGVTQDSINLTFEDIQKNKLTTSIIETLPNIQEKQKWQHLHYFCFPNGLRIFDQKLNLLNDKDVYKISSITSQNTIFSFLLTDQNGTQSYCTCLQIYENITVINSNHEPVKVYVPKSICLISEDNMFEIHKSFLLFLYKNVFYWQTVRNEPFISISLEYINSMNQNTKMYGIEKAQQIMKLVNMSDMKDQKLISRKLFLDYYLSFIFQLDDVEVDQGVSELVVGTLDLETSLKQEVLSLKIKNGFFSLENFQYLTLFKKLSIRNIIDFFTAILLERQIILFATNQNEVMQVCETLLSFIYPLKWRCTYIPYLPSSLTETLNACGAFIVGMNTKDKNNVYKHIDLHDKIIIDIDSDSIESNENMQLPEHIQDFLENNLIQLVKHLDKIPLEQVSKQKILETEILLNMKRIFFTVMLSLLNNFQPFLIPLKQKTSDKNNIIYKKEYLRLFSPDDQAFMEEFVNHTMIFIYFIEEASQYYQENLQATNIQFYLQIYDQLRNQSKEYIDIETNQIFQTYIEPELDMMIGKSISSYMQAKKIDITCELIECILKNHGMKKYQQQSGNKIGSICESDLFEIQFSFQKGKNYVQPKSSSASLSTPKDCPYLVTPPLPILNQQEKNKQKPFEKEQGEIVVDGEHGSINIIPVGIQPFNVKFNMEESKINTKQDSDKKILQYPKQKLPQCLIRSLNNQIPNAKQPKRIFESCNLAKENGQEKSKIEESCNLSEKKNQINKSPSPKRKILIEKRQKLNFLEESTATLCGVFNSAYESTQELSYIPDEQQKTPKKLQKNQETPQKIPKNPKIILENCQKSITNKKIKRKQRGIFNRSISIDPLSIQSFSIHNFFKQKTIDEEKQQPPQPQSITKKQIFEIEIVQKENINIPFPMNSVTNKNQIDYKVFSNNPSKQKHMHSVQSVQSIH